MELGLNLDVPVALIIFRRPAETKRVFESIRSAKPSRLYVISDAARAGKVGEAAAVEECRAIVEEVDWPCEVKTNYAEKNLGLRERVVSGLDWVFSHEEEAIILEDDCVANQSFFDLTSELLEKYRFNSRIAGIGGTNIGDPRLSGDMSYFFTMYPAIWGWATWRRVWSEYRAEIPKLSKHDLVNYGNFLGTRENVKFWRSSFSKVATGRLDTWDYQLAYLCMSREWMWIIPQRNLVTNIGFGESATHTLDKDSLYSQIKSLDLARPYVHPEEIAPNQEFDEWLRNTLHRESQLKSLVLRALAHLPDSLRSKILGLASRFRGKRNSVG